MLFHVGLPKAASSFVQRRVFPAISDASFLHLTSGNLGRLAAVHSGSSAFLRDPESARQAIIDAPQTKVIVSAESFVGDPYDSFRDHAARAAGLKRVWPEAAVFLILRRQDHFCRSLFGQALRKGFPYSPSRFLGLDYATTTATSKVRNFDYRAADFDRIVGTYEALFGKEKVIAVPMEQLIEDPDAFLDRIRGIDSFQLDDLPEMKTENRAYSNLSYQAARILNRLCIDETEGGARFFAWLDRKSSSGAFAWRACRRVLRGGNRLVKRKVRRGVEWLGRDHADAAQPLDEAQLARIREHFAASNRRLSERKGLQLEHYGYF